MTVNRRNFLLRSAATLGAGGLAGVAVADLAGADARAASATDPALSAGGSAVDPTLATRLPFDGTHQSGVITPKGAQATFAALDAIAPDTAHLLQALQALSIRARALTQGAVLPLQEVDEPPADSGTLGTTIPPDALTITIGFGASLFDDRYGLKRRKPVHLVAMEPFANDDLDPARTHGDVLLQISAGQRDTVVHALRELLRPVRDAFALRWTIDGFESGRRGPRGRSSPRNLFGFRDGTANPDVNDAALMRQLVWTDPADGSGEPAWATGGTYQVVRTIRMHVEFWDRVGLREQEGMIGRTRDAGAPLGGRDEYDDPRLDVDPRGDRIPLDAHIRLANPRTPATDDQRIVRRGYNYHRGFDAAGQLDQGLVFVAFNRDPLRQFATIQRRLDEEPMVDYITPVGGGYFFVPPAASGEADFVGSGLFRA
ncbi:iron uptake transporter deferrochelatase/peroxidase subunit [Conexibacter sp. CPCC 206217]|uniref:iron uptake transporter deferrochelatase/peroxidase subunit n=1 Tax=Conexibacter sp. CPCC 206217 TaxID=3064574 RepID=UPI002719655D|nr:iron uptake transporter deferrochelatase/peroxidase subunit [Conexibacter sp. CPCC 206217]MDO8210992.1 iron uptake transporter deferrochelatase/peroxidase subunit [Conexibacter sp. CPCC 206217]